MLICPECSGSKALCRSNCIEKYIVYSKDSKDQFQRINGQLTIQLPEMERVNAEPQRENQLAQLARG